MHYKSFFRSSLLFTKGEFKVYVKLYVKVCYTHILKSNLNVQSLKMFSYKSLMKKIFQCIWNKIKLIAIQGTDLFFRHLCTKRKKKTYNLT